MSGIRRANLFGCWPAQPTSSFVRCLSELFVCGESRRMLFLPACLCDVKEPKWRRWRLRPVSRRRTGVDSQLEFAERKLRARNTMFVTIFRWQSQLMPERKMKQYFLGCIQLQTFNEQAVCIILMASSYVPRGFFALHIRLATGIFHRQRQQRGGQNSFRMAFSLSACPCVCVWMHVTFYVYALCSHVCTINLFALFDSITFGLCECGSYFTAPLL